MVNAHDKNCVSEGEYPHFDPPPHANLEQVFVLVGYKKFNVYVIVPT